ncbi:MAG: hypothetical protein IPJ19_21620, partial [Planctomycetes bacterium]|nr:hypothetical protein [Planctomycetota bacterium]
MAPVLRAVQPIDGEVRQHEQAGILTVVGSAAIACSRFSATSGNNASIVPIDRTVAAAIHEQRDQGEQVQAQVGEAVDAPR